MESLHKLNQSNHRTLSGIATSEYFRQLLDRSPHIKHVLCYVRAWAKAKGIYGTLYGFPGGLAWTVMVICVAELSQEKDEFTLLRIVFKLLEDWDWSVNAMSLGNGPVKRTANDLDAMIVYPPMNPISNCTHSVTPSHLSRIQTELRKATISLLRHKTFSPAALESPLRPTPFFTLFPSFVEVVFADRDPALAAEWASTGLFHLRALNDALSACPDIDKSVIYSATIPFSFEDPTFLALPSLDDAKDKLETEMLLDRDAEPPLDDGKIKASSFYIGFSPTKSARKNPQPTDLSQIFRDWANLVQETGTKKPTSAIRVRVLQKSQIPARVTGGSG
ncbi:putative poly(A) polymerase [Blattamonas nauphoetae]|uniref:polynucleotide adenylyltransferase n=1 Tax=Blattamonas nauphoetae TaxID=2049346 RepID=A0ABQ9X3M4_9EUKA|nr:putative poly(A) polymerase [Blattamonas nauphoetae]